MSDWVISKARRYDGKVKALFVETMGGENVCDLYHDNGKELEPFPNDRGNAHLIVSAPELKIALSAMLERYTSLVNCGDCGHWDPETEAEVIAARAAIAKAEGRSS